MNQAVSKRDEQTQRPRIKLSPRKVIILLILIFTAIITAAAIVVWYGNIYGQRHSDNTELFAVVDGAPEVIEEVYELTELPEGYELKKKFGSMGDDRIVWFYYNENESLSFEQSTRKDFTHHVDIDRSDTTEININGNKSVIVTFNKNDEIWTYIFYDAKDYIFTISTCLPTETAIEVLKSAEIKK